MSELHVHGDGLRLVDENHPVMVANPCYDKEWGNSEVSFSQTYIHALLYP